MKHDISAPSLFIGIDLGTSGCRVTAIDQYLHIHAEVAVPLPTPIHNNKHVEQEPALWWAAVCQCLETLTTKVDTQRVQAIAVDGTSATLLLIDKHGIPLGPALMYNDARATSQAETIARLAPTNTAAQGASCSLAKLLWLSEQGIDNKVAHVVHQADWVTSQLCGPPNGSGYTTDITTNATTDYNNALKMGFDADQKKWPDWLQKLKLPHKLLPKVVAPGTAIGRLNKNLSLRFGLPESTQIIAGTTDSTASFMATGACKAGEGVTALGSTLVVKIIANDPIFSRKHGVYSQPLMINGQQRWLVGGASNSGGAVLQQYFNDKQLQSLTTQLKPKIPTGLNYYPLPSTGERFPVDDAQLKPRLEPRPLDDSVFFQGMLEGIADIEAQAYRLLTTLGAPYPVSIRSTGKGAKNTAWTQIRQQCLHTAGMQTSLLNAQQTQAAFGSALLALNSKRLPSVK